jgi:hypothetical protein
VPGKDRRANVTAARTAETGLGDDGFVHVKPFARTEQDLPDAVEDVSAIGPARGSMPRPHSIH